MKNQKADYLAARLGIVSSTNKVPYGWEIPEDETMPETLASNDTISRFGLVSVVILAGLAMLNIVKTTFKLI